MQRKKIFISSVQSEFAAERQILFDYLTSDALLGKFFEAFIFKGDVFEMIKQSVDFVVVETSSNPQSKCLLPKS